MTRVHTTAEVIQEKPAAEAEVTSHALEVSDNLDTIDGNRIFFRHFRGYTEHLDRKDVTHWVKPGYVVTLAYTFPHENVCLAAFCVKLPEDRFVKAEGTNTSRERLVAAYDAFVAGEDLPEKTIAIDAEDVVEELNKEGSGEVAAALARYTMTTSNRDTLVKEFTEFMMGYPVKFFKHEVIQETILAVLSEEYRGVYNAIQPQLRGTNTIEMKQ